MEDKQKCDNMRFLIYRNITMQSWQNLSKKNYDSFKEKSGKKKMGEFLDLENKKHNWWILQNSKNKSTAPCLTIVW